MKTETGTENYTLGFLPGAVQVLIEWFMLLISTLISYFDPDYDPEVGFED